MLRKLLTVLTVVALLAAPAAADVFANFEDYDLDPIVGLVPGQPVQRTLFAEPNPKGVVGWGIDFVYGEIDASGSLASDIRMTIASPGGLVRTVGGSDTPSDFDWDFQGFGSAAPGPYFDLANGTADDLNNFFKTDPQPKGAWVITFENDWDTVVTSPIDMTDITFRLYKVPEPVSLGLMAVAGLGLSCLRRRTR